MGSYSDLFIVNKIPGEDWKWDKESFEIVSFKYSYPMGVGLLFQNKPQLCLSPCYSAMDGKKVCKSIVAPYNEKNVDEFIKYLKHVAENEKEILSPKEGKTVPFTDHDLFDKIAKTLKGDKYKNKYFLFDINDVVGMTINADTDEEFYKQLADENARVLEDFKRSDFVDKLYSGSFKDSLDDYTRGAFWELLDKSNSFVSGFTKSATLKNKNGKILLVKENTAMANITGLFNLAGFEEAAENDILDMNINEEAEFKDKCPSMDPETHFDAANSGNKEIPVPGGDKEEPSVNAKEVEIPVPGGDKEKPDAKPADGETGAPAPKKATLDDDTYNAALDSLQKSFKEAVEVVEMIKNAERVHESVEEQYKKFMESAMDNAFMDWTYGPLFEKVTLADKDDIKKFIKDNSSKVAKFVDEQRADYTFYKPHTWARFILTMGADPKAWQHILSTKMWQVLGCVTCEDANIQTLTKAMTEEFKDDLGEYKVIAFKAFPSFVDVWRMKFGFQNQLSVWFLIIDKKLPAEFKEAEKAAEKEKKEEDKEDEKKD